MIESGNLSLSKKLVTAFQHLLTMVPASMAVPLVLGKSLGLDSELTAMLVAANFIANGIAILIQVIGIGKSIGGKLPLILGASFIPLSPILAIGEDYGLTVVFGSIIGSAIIIFILSFWMDRIIRFFPKVVVGSFVTFAGISLAPIAMSDLAGGIGAEDYGSVQNILLGFTVFTVVIFTSKFGKGSLKSLSLLLGMVTGVILGGFLGMMDTSTLIEAKWIQIIRPFFFGVPEFRTGPILMMTLFSVVNAIQCFGALSVYDEVVGKETEEKIKISGIRAQIASQAIGGTLGAVPNTVFNENIGLIKISKVADRSAIAMVGVMLIVIGLFPKLSTLMTIIPKSVLGGVTLALFGIIISAGISILSKVDFSDNNNFTIAGTSIAIGVGSLFVEGAFDRLPATASMLLGNGMFMASVSAIVLNAILNELFGKRVGKKG